jgi:hypothetical protein
LEVILWLDQATAERPLRKEIPAPGASDGDPLVQIKVWLLGCQPDGVATVSLRELHGVFQIAMGWEGIHLYRFRLQAARYSSWELSASSPDVTLAALQLRNGFPPVRLLGWMR